MKAKFCTRSKDLPYTLDMKKIGLILLILLCLPILLHVYNPSMRLGGLGLLLGVIGMTLSPVILFGVLLKFVVERWNK